MTEEKNQPRRDVVLEGILNESMKKLFDKQIAQLGQVYAKSEELQRLFLVKGLETLVCSLPCELSLRNGSWKKVCSKKQAYHYVGSAMVPTYLKTLKDKIRNKIEYLRKTGIDGKKLKEVILNLGSAGKTQVDIAEELKLNVNTLRASIFNLSNGRLPQRYGDIKLLEYLINSGYDTDVLKKNT